MVGACNFDGKNNFIERSKEACKQRIVPERN
jgi:hypothetical protein